MKLHTTVLRKDSDCLFQTAHIPALAVVDDVAHQANKRRVDVGDGPYMHEAEALADSCCKIPITLKTFNARNRLVTEVTRVRCEVFGK